MTREEITETVHHTIAEHFSVGLDELNNETRFAEDLGSDSLDCVELTMSIEDDFQIYIEDDEADATKTVGRLIDLVTTKLETPTA